MTELQSADRPVRFGVAGLGVMGRNHVRVLAELDGVDLVAVADPSEPSRAAVERARPVTAYPSVEQMLDSEDLEAVIVAVPTTFHESTAIEAISRDVNTLIEKPLGPDVESARRIRKAASESPAHVSIGHIERFNPAIVQLKNHIRSGRAGRIFQMRSIRTGPLPHRIQDTGVVVDLATHDLDLMRYLTNEPVTGVYAETAQRLHARHEDLSSAILTFENGMIGLLDVNWLTPIKVREISVVSESGLYRLDFVNQDLYFYENSHEPSPDQANHRRGVSEGNMTRYRVDRQEPLRVELSLFADVVRGKADPSELVSVDDGVAAVGLAEAVLESSRQHRLVRFENPV